MSPAKNVTPRLGKMLLGKTLHSDVRYKEHRPNSPCVNIQGPGTKPHRIEEWTGGTGTGRPQVKILRQRVKNNLLVTHMDCFVNFKVFKHYCQFILIFRILCFLI